MDWQAIATGLALLVSSVCGWVARQLYQDMKDLSANLTAFKVSVAERYVPYDRLQDAIKPIMDTLKDIQDTLKGKADK